MMTGVLYSPIAFGYGTHGKDLAPGGFGKIRIAI